MFSPGPRLAFFTPRRPFSNGLLSPLSGVRTAPVPGQVVLTCLRPSQSWLLGHGVFIFLLFPLKHLYLSLPRSCSTCTVVIYCNLGLAISEVQT